MAQHAPAPWVAQIGTTTGQEVIAPGAPKTRRVVARCGGADREANAHLIAAAPDMLAALKALVENPTFELGAPKIAGRVADDKRSAADSAWNGFVEAARAAIAKAECR